MNRLLFVILLVPSLAACGGGGAASSSSGVIPAGLSQNAAQTVGATMPAATGTVGAGYIECDTAANIAAGNNCGGYANLSDGVFAFTAIAATAAGAPIAQQTAGGVALQFANGGYRVLEAASDGAPVVAIAGGPWSSPGGVLSAGGVSYGNRFTVQCLRQGVATLQLQLTSGQALPPATTAFAANVTTVDCTASFALTII
jgi:hypothetical protein